MTTELVDWGFPPAWVRTAGIDLARAWFRDEASTCPHFPAPSTRAIVLVTNNAVYCAECSYLVALDVIANHRTCVSCGEPSTVVIAARPTPKLLGFRMLLPLCDTCASTGEPA